MCADFADKGGKQMDFNAYSGNDLGATYTPQKTTFKVWAPTATGVRVKLYATGSDSEEGARVLGVVDMTKKDKNVWSVEISKDIKNVYYTYLVTIGGTTNETVDIYAKAVGVNGNRGMVVDLSSTNPEGWDEDSHILVDNQTDAVIYELHIRDFSINPNSGISEKNRGKFLAFAERGTTLNNEGKIATGIDYLKNLGINCVHLLPAFDYASVDETRPDDDQFNWGYDPKNYNVPEGSYSTNPYDGNVRIKEFKQMVQSLHSIGISVVMDVVYNHTYSTSDSWFNLTVPDYYYRKYENNFSNGSGCGNETASEHEMYRKYMIDSILYWANEYHIDGFRFDLMGLHDVETMNLIREALDSLPNGHKMLMYGEPWQGGLSSSQVPMAVQSNVQSLDHRIAAFSNNMRDAIKGNVFTASNPGYIQGGYGFSGDIKAGIQANSNPSWGNSWAAVPSQTVTYTSAHDNYTLWDKLIMSVKGGSGYGIRYEDLVGMNKLAAAIIITSEGIPFFQAGEEFARTKFGDHNSYSSATKINWLDWSRVDIYSDLVDYYRGLIEIRKSFTPFRDPTNTSQKSTYFAWSNCHQNVVAYTLKNTLTPATEWNQVAVIFNPNRNSETVTLQTYENNVLPKEWVIIADGTRAGIEEIGVVYGTDILVPACSAMILVDKASFDSTIINTKVGIVTVEHILQSTGEVLKRNVLRGKISHSYTTHLDEELLNDYLFSISVGNTIGRFEEEEVKVYYYYEIDKTPRGTVTVKYIDNATGEEIAEKDISTAKIGSVYNISPKSIDNYEIDLVKLPINSYGTYKEGNIDIVFNYNYIDKKNIKIHYYNSSWEDVYAYIYDETGTNVTLYTGSWPGQSMIKATEKWWSYELTDIDSALVIFNNNGKGQQEPNNVSSHGYRLSDEVWVRNQVVYPTGKVIVNHIDTKGNLLNQEILKGMVDGNNSYSTNAKYFKDMTLITVPDNKTGTFKEHTIIVTYIYKSTVLINSAPVFHYIPKQIVEAGKTITLELSAINESENVTLVYSSPNLPEGATLNSKTGVFKWTPEFSDTYNITFRVSDGSESDSMSVNIAVTTPETLEIEEFSVEDSEAVIGNPIKMNISAKGEHLRYKIIYSRENGNWSTVRDYSPSTNIEWLPKYSGDYKLRLYVTNGTAIKTRDVEVTVVEEDLTITKFVPNAPIISLGDSIMFGAEANGSDIQYKFTYSINGKDWETISDYTKSTVVLWIPDCIGTYTVRLYATDGKITKSKDVSVEVCEAGLCINSVTVNPTTIILGNSVTIKTSVTGSNLKYKYIYSRTGKSWAIIDDYSECEAITWTPKYTGSYILRMYVTDGVTIEHKDIALTVSNSSVYIEHFAATPEVVQCGNSVLLDAVATGSHLIYKYIYSRNGKNWIAIRDFDSNSKASWTPRHAGEYTIRLYVSDGVHTEHQDIKLTVEP